MHSDAHFAIGHTHLNAGVPCQDYAAASILPNGGAYAIVSDGCSTGGRTDVGARIVTLSTAQAIRAQWGLLQRPELSGIPLQQQVTISTASAVLGCDQADLLATCLFAFVSPTQGLIHVQGDGVVAWQQRNGRLAMLHFEWDRNAPLYPAYGRDGYAEFRHFHGDDLNAIKLRAIRWEQAPGESPMPTGEFSFTLGEGINGVTLPLGPVEELRFVAVFTDGVTQIQGVHWPEAVARLLAFKTTTGSFAKRRMNRFLQEVAKTDGKAHDDIAYAVIDLEQGGAV